VRCELLCLKTQLRIASLYFSGGVGIVTLIHWQLWAHLPIIVAEDTLWHLDFGARVTLVALSTCASMATALCCLVKSTLIKQHLYRSVTIRPVRFLASVLLDLPVTLALLWGAVSLAPQLFYMLYVIVIPNLPVHWVALPIGWGTFGELLLLTSTDSLSTLLVGFMMLSVLAGSCVLWLSIPARLLKTKY